MILTDSSSFTQIGEESDDKPGTMHDMSRWGRSDRNKGSDHGVSILSSDFSYGLSPLEGESTGDASTPVKECNRGHSIQKSDSGHDTSTLESDSNYVASTLENESGYWIMVQESATAYEDTLQDRNPGYGPSNRESDSGYGTSLLERNSDCGPSIHESDSACGSSIRDSNDFAARLSTVKSHLPTDETSDKDGSQSCHGKQDIDIMSESLQASDSHKSHLDNDTRSVISDLHEINSQASTRRSLQEVLAGEHLVILLTQHKELQPLFRDALNVINEKRFVDNMRRLLKRFYMDLALQAKTNLEHAATNLLRSRWSRIRLAQKIVDRLSPQKQEDTTRQISEIQLQVRDLEAWIASNAGLSSHLANFPDINVPLPFDEVIEEEEGTDDDGDDDDEFEQPKPLPNIGEMENFLLCGNSFRKFSANICLFLLPASLTSLTRVLMSIPYDRIWFSDEEDPSLVNRLKTMIEDATEENWNWWPLRPRMKTLLKGQTRVHWICVSLIASLRFGADVSSIAERTCGLNCPKNMWKRTKLFCRVMEMRRGIIIYVDRGSLTLWNSSR